MNHAMLMEITADRPMKSIFIGEREYLQRYFMGLTEVGGQFWLHRFLTADAERHLHSHPWSGSSMILCGKYIEEVRMIDPDWTKTRLWHPGMVNRITPSTIHRIAEVEPNTWTMLYIEPGRLETWKFIDDDGAEQIMQASPESWYLDHGARV